MIFGLDVVDDLLLWDTSSTEGCLG